MAVTRYRHSSLSGAWWLARALLLATFVVTAGAARADLYSINSIEVDETAQDAVQAKNKAVGDGQLRAFDTLLQRLTRAEDRTLLPKMNADDIARLMDSMSVEDERTSGTRYIATLTIRFRPDTIRDLLAQFNVPYADQQAPGVLLLTVWKDGKTATIWDPPNPWRDVWATLNVENSITPLFMPLGDLTDIGAITAQDVLSGNEEKIQAMKDRYAVDSVLIAVAEPADGGIRATINGTTAVGPISYDNVFYGAGGGGETTATADSTGTTNSTDATESPDTAKSADNPDPVNAALDQAARTFLLAIENEWKAKHLRLGRADGSSMTVAVPFTSLGEWNNIRERIAATSGIGSVEVKRLSSRGAVVDIVFSGNLGDLNDQFAQNGFELTDIGDTWVLQKR